MKPTSIPFTDALKFWAKLGFISFGGPAGQIAIMHKETVERRGWLSENQFLRALNFCMLLPGPEAQQLATYIGWRMHGKLGGIVAGALMLLTPRTPDLAWVIILALMLTAVYYNTCMPSYYIPISEANIPLKYTGTIVGIVSIVGFCSDIFYYKLCGYFLDAYGPKGYSIIFSLSLVTSIIAIVFAVLLYRNVKNMAATHAAAEV